MIRNEPTKHGVCDVLEGRRAKMGRGSQSVAHSADCPWQSRWPVDGNHHLVKINQQGPLFAEDAKVIGAWPGYKRNYNVRTESFPFKQNIEMVSKLLRQASQGPRRNGYVLWLSDPLQNHVQRMSDVVMKDAAWELV